MEPVRKVRRVEAVRTDNEECPPLLSDYLEKIAGDIYLTLSEFSSDNYVSIRRYYTDRDGNLRPRKEGAALTLSQFAIFVDSMYEIEPRYWASEEGLSMTPFEQYVGPWQLKIDVFGNFFNLEALLQPNKESIGTAEQGAFPFRCRTTDRWREKSTTCWNVIRVWNILFRVTKVRIHHSRSVRSATHSNASFRKPTKKFFLSKASRTINDWYLYQTFFIFSRNHIRTIVIYSCRHFCGVLFYYSGLYLINYGNEKLCCWNLPHRYLGTELHRSYAAQMRLEARGSRLVARGSWLRIQGMYGSWLAARVSWLSGSDAARGSRLSCGSRFRAPCSVLRVQCSALRAFGSMLRAPCSALRAPRSMLRALCSVQRAPRSVLRASCVRRACVVALRACVRRNLWELVGTYGEIIYSMKRTLVTIYTIVFITHIYTNVQTLRKIT